MRTSRFVGLTTVALVLAVAIGGCLVSQPVVESSLGISGLPAYGELTTTQSVQVISTLQENPNFVLLDIRTPAEVDASHISGASELDFYSESFREDLDALDRELIYLIYCRTGNRTGQTMGIMEDLGFESVYDMGGGITQWIAAGHPVCGGPLDAEHSCSGELPSAD